MKIFIRILAWVLFSTILGLYAFPWSYFGIHIPYFGKDYKLGLDLQGGIELDYKVDLDEVRNAPDYTLQKEKTVIEGLKSIIDRRVEVLRINDSQISSASYGGEEHIIVQIPLKGNNSKENSANIARAKEAIGRVVKIEFKERRIQVTEEDKKERKNIALKALEDAKKSQYEFSVTANKYKDSYENIEYSTLTGSLETITKTIPVTNINSKGFLEEIISGTGPSSMSLEDGQLVQSGGKQGYFIVHVENIIGEGDTKEYQIAYLFITEEPSDWVPAKDMKGRILNDKYFVKSSVQYNEAFQPLVELTFNDEGGDIFGELTKRLTGQQIAIFVGGQLLTAPRVNEPILAGKAVITGNYNPEEANKLSNDINTGVVPAPIYLTSERSIDSRLGSDSLQALIVAGIIGYLAIVVFLVVVYRLAGVSASFVLLFYTIFVLAFVKALGIVLTLASIAGLILSIGMAIDANVLIFERIKDGIREGKTKKQYLELGFKESFSAIWDTHLTGFIVSVILFVFGINLIKGFGLMLLIGTVISLFIFYFVSRVFVFLIAETKVGNNAFIGYKE